ncbi:MAG TPA: tRNA guanosine(34) transglycosylase Tgt [Spirochaetia bacterium]|nr:tRNA guanosine(34) transglycosylase Tgt [Spirochaetia bacterium]
MFTITGKDISTKARTGVLSLPHGSVDTPAFMPVGTNGTVKAVRTDDLDRMGIRLILGNTYHLYLRPGVEVIKKFGGLHGFMNWEHNILTDSGGFQLFSLASLRKIETGGVRFRSHIDGSSHTLTPEDIIEIQEALRSDIMMPLDICSPPGITWEEAEKALSVTTDWARRSKARWENRPDSYDGKLFGIIQGNFYKDLRKRSAEEILSLDLPGVAIGGLSVGESFLTFTDFLQFTASLLPEEKPHYLMGIGTPEYIFSAVENGIDLFDCVFPTRIARNGSVFTRRGIIALKKEEHRFETGPIDESCTCPVCAKYSRAYLRHLIKTSEILGAMLASLHNLSFLASLLSDIRRSIAENRFLRFKEEFLLRYNGESQ